MNVNLPVWGYYPPNNKKFIDPLYIPYQKQCINFNNHDFDMMVNDGIQNPNDGGGMCGYKTMKKQGEFDGLVNPALVRKGWGMGFQLLHPKDPCPEGWTKGEDGWCVENEPEFGNNGLYSKDAFVPKYQYWNGYAPLLKDPNRRQINEFDNKSNNPYTGEYVVYHNPKPSTNRNKYGYLPSRDSLIA